MSVCVCVCARASAGSGNGNNYVAGQFERAMPNLQFKSRQKRAKKEIKKFQINKRKVRGVRVGRERAEIEGERVGEYTVSSRLRCLALVWTGAGHLVKGCLSLSASTLLSLRLKRRALKGGAGGVLRGCHSIGGGGGRGKFFPLVRNSLCLFPLICPEPENQVSFLHKIHKFCIIIKRVVRVKTTQKTDTHTRTLAHT